MRKWPTSEIGFQQGYVSLTPVVVQNDGLWHEVIFPITSTDLVAVGTFQTYNQTMTDVGHFRIYHSTNVAWKSVTEIDATMGIDNIRGNIGPVDDFEDGTTQSWQEGPSSPTQPTNISVGGPDGTADTLAYSATGLPAGLSIDPVSGVIGGTPTTTSINNVTVTVSDGTDSADASFIWDISGPNDAPDVTNPGTQVDEPASVVNLPIAATDPNGDTLNYSAIGLPLGLAIDAGTGVISGSPTTLGTTAVTVTVGDGIDSTDVVFNWTINSLPAVANPGDQFNLPNDIVNLAIVASDADGDTLIYSAIGLPAVLNINAATGVISGSPVVAGISAVTVTVTAPMPMATR